MLPPKKINLDKLRAEAQDAINIATLEDEIIGRIKPLLEAQHGKILNKRIANAVSAGLGVEKHQPGVPRDMYVYWSGDTMEVRVSRGAQRVTIRIQLYSAAPGGDRFDWPTTYMRDFVRYENAAATIAAKRKTLEYLEGLVTEYNACIKQLEDAHNAFGPLRYLVQ